MKQSFDTLDFKEVITITKYLYSHRAGLMLALKKYKHLLSYTTTNKDILGTFVSGFPNYATTWKQSGGGITLDKHQFHLIPSIREYLDSLLHKNINKGVRNAYTKLLNRATLREVSTFIENKHKNALTPLEFYGHLIDLDLWIIVKDTTDLKAVEQFFVSKGLYSPEYDPTARLEDYPAEIYYDIHILPYEEFRTAIKNVPTHLIKTQTTVYAMYNPLRKKRWDIGQDFFFSFRPLSMTPVLAYEFYTTWNKVFTQTTVEDITTILTNSTDIDWRIPFLLKSDPVLKKLLMQRLQLMHSIVTNVHE